MKCKRCPRCGFIPYVNQILDLALITDSISIWIGEKCRYQEKIANRELIPFFAKKLRATSEVPIMHILLEVTLALLHEVLEVDEEIFSLVCS